MPDVYKKELEIQTTTPSHQQTYGMSITTVSHSQMAHEVKCLPFGRVNQENDVSTLTSRVILGVREDDMFMSYIHSCETSPHCFIYKETDYSSQVEIAVYASGRSCRSDKKKNKNFSEHPYLFGAITVPTSTSLPSNFPQQSRWKCSSIVTACSVCIMPLFWWGDGWIVSCMGH